MKGPYRTDFKRKKFYNTQAKNALINKVCSSDLGHSDNPSQMNYPVQACRILPNIVAKSIFSDCCIREY